MISPIADFAGHLSLEFVDFTLCKDDINIPSRSVKNGMQLYAHPI